MDIKEVALTVFLVGFTMLTIGFVAGTLASEHVQSKSIREENKTHFQFWTNYYVDSNNSIREDLYIESH